MQTSLLFLHTDQKNCYDSFGEKIPCEGSGQDGEFSIPLPDHYQRFVEENDTVIDNNTGLCWTKNANLAEFPMTWEEAFAYIAEMNKSAFSGYDDWRLPNRRELRSIISYETKKPSLPIKHPFVNVFLGWYWTSTTAAIDTRYAWYVHLEGARMFYGKKNQYYLLWPVRGDATNVLPKTGQKTCYDLRGEEISCSGTGQDGEIQSGHSWPTPRFVVNGDIIHDRLSNLYWLKKANFTSDPVNWSEALSAVAKLNASNLGEIGRWRLPNINELESLTDCSAFAPALPQNHPFIDVQEDYWSSTTSFFETDWAWVLYMNKGALGVGYKKGALFSVWPVCAPNKKQAITT